MVIFSINKVALSLALTIIYIYITIHYKIKITIMISVTIQCLFSCPVFISIVLVFRQPNMVEYSSNFFDKFMLNCLLKTLTHP